jgi:hypothetical protein
MMNSEPSLLAEALPRFDANEVHRLWVSAPPEVVFAAVKEVTVREVRLLLPLMAVRGVPRLLTRRRRFRPLPSARVLDAFLEVGFVLLGERPGTEIAVGAIGRFWRLAGNDPVLSGHARASSPSKSPVTRRRRWDSSCVPRAAAAASSPRRASPARARTRRGPSCATGARSASEAAQSAGAGSRRFGAAPLQQLGDERGGA